ncbi:MAG: hypothetical protein ACXWYM_00100 [Candidatus Binatia bacterium]
MTNNNNPSDVTVEQIEAAAKIFCEKYFKRALYYCSEDAIRYALKAVLIAHPDSALDSCHAALQSLMNGIESGTIRLETDQDETLENALQQAKKALSRTRAHHAAPSDAEEAMRTAFDSWWIKKNNLHPSTDTTYEGNAFEPWQVWKTSWKAALTAAKAVRGNEWARGALDAEKKYSAAARALNSLVLLKKHKQKNGADDFYRENKEAAWKQAEEALNGLYEHGDEVIRQCAAEARAIVKSEGDYCKVSGEEARAGEPQVKMLSATEVEIDGRLAVITDSGIAWAEARVKGEL